jgi:hypothetical protein
VKFNWPAATPSPDILAVADTLIDWPVLVCAESEAFPVTAMLPDTLPADFGVKSTVKVALCEGFKVSGNVNPLMLKLELLADACVTVTADPPEFVRLMLCVWLLPTMTLPKDSALGLIAKVPAFTAVPETAMRSCSAAVERVIVPVGFPGVWGENATIRFVLWPGARVTGRAGELILKLEFEADALLMVTVLDELFAMVSDRVLSAPATTVPKFNDAVPRARFCWGCVPPAEEVAPQPNMPLMLKSNSASAMLLPPNKPFIRLPSQGLYPTDA